MKRSVGLWQFFGFAAVSLLGTLLHFLYEWSGKSLWAAPFSGVNESTWEHMKLLFWPMLLFAAAQRPFFKERKDFWCVKLVGTAVGLALIPTLFYLYNGVVGKSPDWLNISIFFVCAAAAFLYETRLFNKESLECKSPKIALALLATIALAFVVFTFKAPPLGIFTDPLTGSSGI